MTSKFKKNDFIQWERLSIFIGPREGASREEKPKGTGETVSNTKRTRSIIYWGAGQGVLVNWRGGSWMLEGWVSFDK